MDLNKQKEAFQRAYICALAAQAGYNPGYFDEDDDSVDITLRARGFNAGIVKRPQIDFQLKCSSRNLINGDVIKFALPRKNYDDLRLEDLANPRYLAVLLVPEACAEWVVHHNNHMALHERCFWVSLRNAPATDNLVSVTVDIPLHQRLTTDSLRLMMEAASMGAAL